MTKWLTYCWPFFKQNHGLGMHMQALLDWPVYVIVRPSVNGF